MKKKIAVFILGLYVLCCMAACQSEKEGMTETTEYIKKEATSPYLSITQSYYEDAEQTSMKSRCLVYDLTEKTLEEKGSVPYTSAYPLTMYSDRADKVYYTALSEKGDQIYSYESEENSEKKTTEFCLINYMMQCGNKYFAVARLLDNFCMEPFVFGEDFTQLSRVFYDEKDDRVTWTVSAIPGKDSVIFSYYSDEAERKSDETEKEDSAGSNIAILDMQTNEIRDVYHTDRYVWGVASDGDTLYICSAPSGTSNKKKNKCYEVNLATQESKELDIPVCITGDMALWNHVLYFLGYINDVRGVYSYNLDNGQTELIMRQSDKEFINGLSLNY